MDICRNVTLINEYTLEVIITWTFIDGALDKKRVAYENGVNYSESRVQLGMKEVTSWPYCVCTTMDGNPAIPIIT